MDAQQIKSLLSDSAAHYQKRLLKKAANTAQIALDFGKNEGAPVSVLIDANLLLNRIYTTNGIYRGEPSFFKKAETYIAEAKRLMLDNVEHTERLSDVLLYEGITAAGAEDYKTAAERFDEVLELSYTQQNDAGIISALCAKSNNAVLQNNFSEALVDALNAYSFLPESSEAENEELLCEVLEKVAEGYIKQRKYGDSLEYSQQLLQTARRCEDVEKELIALKFIAIVCAVKANYKIGMQYFFEALDKSEQIGYRPNTAHILVNIATIYAHLYNYDDALSRYERVLAEFDDVVDDNTRAAVFNNSGNIHYATDRHNEALKCFTKSLKYAEKINYHPLIAHSLAQLSRAQYRLKNYETSLAYAEMAEDQIKELGTVNGKQINQLNLAKLYLRNNEPDRALELCNAGIETARQLKDDAGILRGYRILANIYKTKGEFEAALEHQTQYSRLQEDFSKTQRNRRFLDLEIRHAIKEQEKEIADLTKENDYQALLLQQSDQIAKQNEELLSVNEDLRQFAYVASHDLKEPLRMISSYVRLIEKHFGSQITPDKQQYFDFIKDGTRRMNNLLEDLLRYATIGKSGIDKEDVDVNRVLEVCKFNLKVRIEENNAVIDIPVLPTVCTNKPLLNQLFQNLLSNAVKFRKPDVAPVVLVRHEENETEHIFSVADNGIGIPAEFQERIFIIFQRLHARTKYEGTGIGLAICQKITQKLGGRLWLKSEAGEGSTFYFSLPKEQD